MVRITRLNDEEAGDRVKKRPESDGRDGFLRLNDAPQLHRMELLLHPPRPELRKR